VKDLAKISALSYKAKESAILVVEDLAMETPKTKQLVEVLKGLNVENKKSIIVLPEYNDNVYLSTRNVPNVTSTLLADINTYEIMNADFLVITESTANIFADNEVAAEA
jgi:large subunit ribosomal protein L4